MTLSFTENWPLFMMCQPSRSLPLNSAVKPSSPAHAADRAKAMKANEANPRLMMHPPWKSKETVISRANAISFPPLHEAFQRIKLRQPELIIDFRGVAVAVFGALPEFAAIRAAGKHGPVLLRLMAEDRLLLALQVAGTQGHDALDLVRLPFLPGAAVEPDLKLLPLATRLADGVEDGVGADAVRAVRVGQLAGNVDLRGLEALQEADNVLNVLRMDRRFGDGAGAIKAQVHEFELLGRDAARKGAGAGLGLADQLLDVEQVVDVGLAGFLALEEMLHAFLDAVGPLLVDAEQLIERADVVGEAPGIVIEDGDVAAGHVGDVHLVPLLDQANDCPPHADDVVVRMRTEDKHGRLRLLTPDSRLLTPDP